MKKKLFGNTPMVTAVALGVLCCSIVSIFILILSAYMIECDNLQFNTGSFIIPLVANALSVLTGSILSGKLVGERRSVACAMTAGGYLILLLVIALLFMDGIHGQILWGIGAIVAGTLGGIVICNGNKSHKRKKAKSRFR